MIFMLLKKKKERKKKKKKRNTETFPETRHFVLACIT